MRAFDVDGYLWQIEKRYLMTDLIIRFPDRIWQVKELVTNLSAIGVDLYDRPSKYVSDLLRTEVARRRVARVGWGRYQLGMIPDTTRRRIQKRARSCREHLAEVARQRSDRTEPHTWAEGGRSLASIGHESAHHR